MATKRTRAFLDISTTGEEKLKRVKKSMDDIADKTGVAALSAGFLALNAAIDKVADGSRFAQAEIRRIIDVSNQVQRSQLTWKALLGTVEDTDKRVRELQEFAFSAPFELRSIDKAALSMEALGRYSTTALKAAGDAAAIFGTDITEATDALLGAARGELDMLKRFGVAKYELAKEMGKTVKEVSFQTEKDLEEAYDAAIRVMQRKFGGGMDELVTTTEGKLSMVSDAVFKARMKMGEGGLTEGMNRGLDIVLDRPDSMHASGVFEDIGRQLGGVLFDAIDKAEDLLTFVEEMELDKKLRGGPTMNPFKAKFMGGSRTASGDAAFDQAANIGYDVIESLGFDRSGPGKAETYKLMNGPLRTYVMRAAVGLLEGTMDAEAARALIMDGAVKIAFSGGVTTGPRPSYGREKAQIDAIVPPGSGAGPKRPNLEEGLAEEERRVAELDKQHDPLMSSFFPVDKIQNEWAPAIEMTHSEMVQGLIDNLRDGSMTMEEIYDRLGSRGQAAYRGIAAAGGRAIEGLTRFVGDALDYQGKKHIKLGDVAKAAALAGVAGSLDAYAELWRKKGDAAALEAGLYALAFDGPAAAKATAIAFGWYALAGTVGGVSAALERKSQRAIGNDVGDAPSYSDGSSGGSGTSSIAGSSAIGSRIVAAGAAPTSVVYNLSVNYYGPAIYSGSGGMNEWFRNDLWPLIRDAQRIGA